MSNTQNLNNQHQDANQNNQDNHQHQQQQNKFANFSDSDLINRLSDEVDLLKIDPVNNNREDDIALLRILISQAYTKQLIEINNIKKELKNNPNSIQLQTTYRLAEKQLERVNPDPPKIQQPQVSVSKNKEEFVKRGQNDDAILGETAFLTLPYFILNAINSKSFVDLGYLLPDFSNKYSHEWTNLNETKTKHVPLTKGSELDASDYIIASIGYLNLVDMSELSGEGKSAWHTHFENTTKSHFLQSNWTALRQYDISKRNFYSSHRGVNLKAWDHHLYQDAVTKTQNDLIRKLTSSVPTPSGFNTSSQVSFNRGNSNNLNSNSDSNHRFQPYARPNTSFDGDNSDGSLDYSGDFQHDDGWQQRDINEEERRGGDREERRDRDEREVDWRRRADRSNFREH